MILQAFGPYGESAAVCYRRAHMLEPKSFRWVYYLALVQGAEGGHAEAIATLREALRLDPEYLPAQLRLGGYLLAVGKWQEAAQLFEGLVKKHPENAEAFYGLGRAHAVHNELDLATESLRKGTELFPDYGAAHYALAQTYKRQGKMDMAVHELELHEKHPTSAPDAGDELLNEIQALALSASDDLREGLELMKQGKLPEAAAKLESALQTNPNLLEAHVNLVSVFGQLGQFAKGEEHFQAAERLEPKSAANHLNHGLLLAGQGRFPEAEGEFRKTLEIDSAFPGARTNLGLSLEAQRRLSEALAEFRKSIEMSAEDTQAHFALGRILVNQEKYQEGIEHLMKCANSAEELNKPAYLYALGAAYARSGDLKNGVHYLHQARDAAAARNQSRMAESIDEDLKTLQTEPSRK